METTDALPYETTAQIPKPTRLYAYQCAVCGDIVEEFRSSRERNISPWCAQCATKGLRLPMRRVITPPAIRGTTVSKP